VKRFALLLAVLSCGCVHRMSSPPSAIVFVAQRVYTMDPAQPVAEAVVVKDGKIAFVGSRQDAFDEAGSGAAVEEWPASTIVPGLVDSHGHLASLGRALSLASLETASSEADAVKRVQAVLATTTQGGWVLGRGWDQNDWPGQAFPTRASLDAAFPGQPVFLTRVDGHAAWVSSEALKRAGITRETKDPEGGRIVRDAQGEPTGVLVDNAIDLVSAKVPPPDGEVLKKRLKLALETCARVGLTQVHDAGMDLATFRILQGWDMLGALPVRVYAMADAQGDEAQTYLGQGTFSGRLLEMKAAKLLADGALGSRGAALKAPYSDEPGQSGLLLLPPEELERRATEFSERGFQVAVHAIGDRANSLVLDILEKLSKERPNARHRVEHAQILSEADVPRFAKAGIIASYQPTHATSDMPWAEERVGKERLRFAYAWKSMLETGAHVAFGSDFPVESPNPLWGLYAARTRTDHQGKPEGGWMPEQKLTGEEALAGFTTGGAYAAFAEDHRGMLKKGYDADLVVLPVDPVKGPPQALLDAKVQVTLVAGVDVYRAKP